MLKPLGDSALLVQLGEKIDPAINQHIHALNALLQTNAIARAIKRFSAELILVGLAGSALYEAGLAAGLKDAGEGFPDRGYNPDGTLISRNKAGAVIESPEEVAKNAVKLIREFGGKGVRLDTLCLHGDNKHAVENAILLRKVLSKNGIEIMGPK